MIPRDEEHRPRSPRSRRPLAGSEMPARSTSPPRMRAGGHEEPRHIVSTLPARTEFTRRARQEDVAGNAEAPLPEVRGEAEPPVADRRDRRWRFRHERRRHQDHHGQQQNRNRNSSGHRAGPWHGRCGRPANGSSSYASACCRMQRGSPRAAIRSPRTGDPALAVRENAQNSLCHTSQEGAFGRMQPDRRAHSMPKPGATPTFDLQRARSCRQADPGNTTRQQTAQDNARCRINTP